MTNSDKTPTGKIARSVAGGKTAARMGGQFLKYALEKPFLSESSRSDAKRTLAAKSAATLFEGLCQLKGTALKVAQLLSLELDIFPQEVRAQLERSYNQVPPINRALVRKLLHNAYGKSPEDLFAWFDSQAFAAASLGQVHEATSRDGKRLALKIQYPGIRETIRSDMALIKGLLRPMGEYQRMLPAMEEIEARLLEETDYLREAANAAFFRERLRLERILIPEIHDDWCTNSMLCLGRLAGTPLNLWLESDPGTADKDATAQTLQDLFTTSLYELRTIHADPNPGNFLIMDDGSVGLVDFGCVKHFDPAFVDLVRQLPATLAGGNNDACFTLFRRIGTIPEHIDESLEKQVREALVRYSKWFGRLYAVPFFDFSREKGFIKEGKAISMDMKEMFRRLHINPDFIFLDRTRYGLLRLFERMEARVAFRNAYEGEIAS